MARDPYKYTSPFYDYVVGPFGLPLRKVRRRLAPPKQGMKVLDVGCGTGLDLELYHQEGCIVHGVDLSPGMLKVARRKFGESVDLKICDAAQMPYEDETFDLVLSTLTLHEMPFEVRGDVIQEMIRVFKKDGRLLLTDFSPGPYPFPMGWITRMGNLIMELIAGQEHFNNGLDFLKRGGLMQLIKRYPLTIEKSINASAGNITFLLLSKY